MPESEAFPYTFGIEEEFFFLTHPKSRALAVLVPRSLMRAFPFATSRDGAMTPSLRRSSSRIVSSGCYFVVPE